MIEKGDALTIFRRNMQRTNSLIAAIEKIDAYNRLYQDRAWQENAEIAASIRTVQNSELVEITTACAEHAIISLATAFETYYSELTQELLAVSPRYFSGIPTEYSNGIAKLVGDKPLYDYEDIAKALKLRSRQQYSEFYERYQLPLLVGEEVEFINQIFKLRNYFVHNASRAEKRSRSVRADLQSVSALKTRAKRMRTKLERMVPKIDARIKRGVTV